jgi:Sec-independent protein translocase protein TatA
MDDLITPKHLLILLMIPLVIFGTPKLKALLVRLGIM